MNRIEDTLQTLREIRLPDAARSRMRDELASYAEMHAVPARTSIRSPFSILRVRMYASVAAVLTLVVALGGTAYASERALPGDALYPVKVGITEPLQTALVPSNRGKAAWHAILAERRLDEAAQLAARGSLSPAAQTELASNFDAQVAASEHSADRLQHDGDASGSLSVRSDLEARLAAHSQILSVIAAHYALATSTNAESTHSALENMLAVVSSHQQQIVSTRLALEDALAPHAKESDTASTAAKIAVVVHQPTHVHFGPNVTPAMQVETAATVRTEEEQNILDRHATFLAKFLPIASTTATSTATTTATTTQVTATTTASTTEELDKEKLER